VTRFRRKRVQTRHRSTCRYLSILLVGFCFAADPCCTSVAQASQSKIRFGCRLLGPVDPTNVVFEVTYECTAGGPVAFRSPVDMPELYRGLKLLADGKDIPYAHPVYFADHVGFTNIIRLVQGDSYSFRFAGNSVWDLPNRWEVLEVIRRNIHDPYGGDGPLVVENADETYVFDFDGRRIQAGRAPRGELPPVAQRGEVQFSVSMVRPSEGLSQLDVLFKNTGNQDVYVPVFSDVSQYRGIDLLVDGQRVPYRNRGVIQAFKPASKAVRLPPGEDYTFRLPMTEVWSLPQAGGIFDIGLRSMQLPRDVEGLPCVVENRGMRFRLARTVDAVGSKKSSAGNRGHPFLDNLADDEKPPINDEE
jgi:hypothetical protein